MTSTFIKVAVALAPTVLLVLGSAVVFFRRQDLWSGFQMIGSVCLLIVVLAHICEALAWLPAMGWGRPHSIGHYVDLSCAVLGVTLFPVAWIETRALG